MNELSTKSIRENILWFTSFTKQNGTHDVLCYCIGYYGNISPKILDTVLDMCREGYLVAGSHYTD